MILDAQGNQVKVEPIPERPPENEWERRQREVLLAYWHQTLRSRRVTIVT